MKSPILTSIKTLSSKVSGFYMLLFVGLLGIESYAQVGINNIDPKSSLEITASDSSSPANTDGILIPRVDEFPSTDPGADQNGMLLFLTTTDGSDEPGFYYWDNSSTDWVWVNRLKRINDLIDGKSDNDGSNNGSSVFLGISSGAADDASNNKNIGVGYQSLTATTDGENNTAIGNGALKANTSGNNNIGIGSNALGAATNSGNIAIGTDAMGSSTSGSNNVAIGISALEITTTGGSMAIGNNALAVNTSGANNTALGGSALRDNTTGTNNTAIGAYSLRRHTVGEGNMAIGAYSLNKFTGVAGVANGNTAIGNLSLNRLTTGSGSDGIGNTAVGFEALEFGTDQNYNTAVGQFAGFHAGRDGTLIENNTFVGKSAGFAATGSENTYIGSEAGGDGGNGNYRTGSGNVYIGYRAGDNTTMGNNSNHLAIENSASTTPLIFGDFEDNEVAINWDVTTAPTHTFSVNGDTYKSSGGGNWDSSSDRRLKKNIQTISPDFALDKITSLRGVTYLWNDDKTGFERPTELQYGFIAQEINEVFPEKEKKDNLGYYTSAYGTYDPLFVQAFKELKRRLEEKDQQIETLQAKLDKYEALEARLTALEALLEVGDGASKAENIVKD